MSEPSGTGPSLLERLDLALAERLVRGAAHVEVADDWHRSLTTRSPADTAWIGSLLRLRGFLVFDDDVREVLAGRGDRLPHGSQERAMIHGMVDALQMLRERCGTGNTVDGWFLVELFRTISRGVARFRGHYVRKDLPWDAVLHMQYPRPDELHDRIETFDLQHRFGDQAHVFDAMHPVRQSFRILWQVGRLAPFPDCNQIMAWVAMCGHLLARGYPLLPADDPDRGFVPKLLAGKPPTRVVQFERRLLAAVEAL